MGATTVGSRLRCDRCGTEIIVVKATDTDVVCCGQAMLARES